MVKVQPSLRCWEQQRVAGIGLAMSVDMAQEKTPPAPAPEPAERSGSREDLKKDADLGYAQDAGRPGGEQDLDAKTETEGEHDSFGRHE
jgi:hypothetical protein